ncbi:hypothetical protein IFO70_13475 [Phormidium tenue FACHB-886]|nr:hypothetical protein [Phormidium tenue FACHB-886]
MFNTTETPAQLTFYYLNGQSESFNIYGLSEDETQQDFRLEVKHLLQKEWWILNLPEQTVMINVANVTKVEVKPVMQQLKGEGVFPVAERITALNRH